MKLVATAGTAGEAYLIQGELAQAGIRASVLGETLDFARGEIPMTQQTLPQVWVLTEDFERAVKIVEAFFQEARDAAHNRAFRGIDWTCANCGEKVEAQFGACWNCGRDRHGEGGDETGSTNLD